MKAMSSHMQITAARPGQSPPQAAPLVSCITLNWMKLSKCHLRTKKPAWNSELQHWIHHFGGRIKIGSSNNFLLVHDESSPSAEDLDGLGLGMGGGISKNTESQVLQYATDYNRGDVIVLHGKVPFYLHVLGDFSSRGSCAFPFPLLYPIYI